jgi:hypothetical protein
MQASFRVSGQKKKGPGRFRNEKVPNYQKHSRKFVVTECICG